MENDEKLISGRIGKSLPPDMPEAVPKVLEGESLDRHLKLEAAYSELSSEPSMRKWLHELLWSRCEIFKGLGGM